MSTQRGRGLLLAGLLSSLLACGGGSEAPPAEAPQTGRLQIQEQIDGPLPRSSFQPGSALPSMSSVSFRVQDLPTLTSKNDPPAEGRGRLVKELTVTRDGEAGLVRFTGSDGRFGRLTFDDSSSTTSSVRVQCGKWAAAHLSLHILDIRQDGRATFTRIDGIFDGSACEAVERARVSFEPAVLVPGYLFAFRTCSTSPCDGGNERVTFLMPPLADLESEAGVLDPLPVLHEPFGVASFEPVQGAAATLTAIVNEAAVAQRFRSRPSWMHSAPLVIGIDLGRTTEEPEPVLVASFGVVTQPPPTPQPLLEH